MEIRRGEPDQPVEDMGDLRGFDDQMHIVQYQDHRGCECFTDRVEVLGDDVLRRQGAPGEIPGLQGGEGQTLYLRQCQASGMA